MCLTALPASSLPATAAAGQAVTSVHRELQKSREGKKEAITICCRLILPCSSFFFLDFVRDWNCKCLNELLSWHLQAVRIWARRKARCSAGRNALCWLLKRGIWTALNSVFQETLSATEQQRFSRRSAFPESTERQRELQLSSSGRCSLSRGAQSKPLAPSALGGAGCWM